MPASLELMTQLFQGVESGETKSIFPTFFHDALEERMGEVGPGDDEDMELSEEPGAIIHQRSLYLEVPELERGTVSSLLLREPNKKACAGEPENHGTLRKTPKTKEKTSGEGRGPTLSSGHARKT
ncbi:MAG: hypothetical protein ACP5OP_04790 [Leptospirillia bacterium]